MENLQSQNNPQKAVSLRLGFHEIVPGNDCGIPQDQTEEIHIPEFDLSQHLMADQRRVSSARRQGPGQKSETPPVAESVESTERPVQKAENAVSTSIRSVKPTVSAYRHPLIQRHAIVEDIVRRDIQRLCLHPKTVS